MGLTYEPLDSAVSQRLDDLFGTKDCLIEVNPGRVLLPPKYQDIGDRIRDLQVRPDDVWVVSYPRTGGTWTQEMVWCIGNDLDFERAKLIQQFRTPCIELTALLAADDDDFTRELGDTVEMVDQMDSPRYIKSHLPWGLLPEQMVTVKPKIVYVARNPKDMCVSYYHYCRLVHQMKGSFEEFADLFLKDKAPVGPMWSHILEFWKRRDESNVLFLKYEDMKRDLPASIRTTAKFLNKQLTEDEVLKLADYLSFDQMKNNPAVNLELVMAKKRGPEYMSQADVSYIRKGEVGDWKNYMNDLLVSKFDHWISTNLEGTGLTLD